MSMRVIVVGGGEVGRTIAERLAHERNDVTLVDNDVTRVRQIAEHLDVRALAGNGASPAVLLRAGIESAEMVIAVTNSDQVNLLACLMAGAASAATTRVARVRDPDYVAHADVLQRSGLKLDLAINPEQVTVDKVLRVLSVRQAADVASFAEGKVLLVAMRIPADNPLVDARLADVAKLRPSAHVLLVAINRRGRVLIPKGGDRVHADDIVYAVVESSRISELTEFFSVEERKARRVFIHGGTRIGRMLALALEKEGVHVKIIEQDEALCESLSKELEKAVVLHGEGADRSLLLEENVAGADAFIALSDDQEDNILSALLAKRLGAETVFALIERPGYTHLVGEIGIDVPLSPRLAAVSSILQFVRRGNVQSVVAFQEDEAEAIEVEAMETSSIVGTPLKDVKFPKGAIIGAVVRGEETLIPKGSSIIEPGDRVIIFTLTKAIKQVEKAVSVSLEFF